MPSLKSNIGSRQNISLDDVCTLLSITVSKDSIGNNEKDEKPYLVFCSKLSVNRTEFAAAGQLGHKPEIMLVVDSDSYDNEKFVEYQGKKYSIYKAYQRIDGFTEIYCEVKTGD